MKKTIKLLFVLAITLASTAFISSSNQGDWKLHKEVQGIKIFTKVSSCQLEHTNKSNQYIIFKYVNISKKNLRISGRVDAYYNNICRSCNLDSPNEYEFMIDLKPGKSQEGNCSDEQKAFKLFYSSADSKIAPLSKFVFSKLNVSEF